MSCCGDQCGCGSGCKCADGCKGCKMFPDLTRSGEEKSYIMISGVAHQQTHFGGSGTTNGGHENKGCKCESNCTCNPSNFK